MSADDWQVIVFIILISPIPSFILFCQSSKLWLELDILSANRNKIRNLNFINAATDWLMIKSSPRLALRACLNVQLMRPPLVNKYHLRMQTSRYSSYLQHQTRRSLVLWWCWTCSGHSPTEVSSKRWSSSPLSCLQRPKYNVFSVVKPISDIAIMREQS